MVRRRELQHCDEKRRYSYYTSHSAEEICEYSPTRPCEFGCGFCCEFCDGFFMIIWTFQDRLQRTWEIRTEIRSGIRTEIRTSKIITEYDRAKVPPYNGNDPRPPLGSLDALLFPPLLLINKVENKGTQGVRARYDAELPPIISIVRYPGRPVILGMDKRQNSHRIRSAGCRG